MKKKRVDYHNFTKMLKSHQGNEATRTLLLQVNKNFEIQKKALYEDLVNLVTASQTLAIEYEHDMHLHKDSDGLTSFGIAYTEKYEENYRQWPVLATWVKIVYKIPNLNYIWRILLNKSTATSETPSQFFAYVLRGLKNYGLNGEIWNISMSTFIKNIDHYIKFTRVKKNKTLKKTSKRSNSDKAKLIGCRKHLGFLMNKYESKGSIPLEEISNVLKNYL